VKFLPKYQAKDLMHKLQLYIELLKLSMNDTRLRGMLFMFINQQMTLTEFSTALGRSKSTVLHHLKKFEDLGLITRINKYYKSELDFITMANLTLKDLEKDEINQSDELEKLLFNKDIHTLEIIKEIYSQAITTYSCLKQEKGLDFWKKNPTDYDLWLLDDEDIREYGILKAKFKEYLKHKNNRREQNSDLSQKKFSYLAVNSLFPVRELTKFDADKKEFIN
jgi:DNA-binding transcriptional ArsR family regulator